MNEKFKVVFEQWTLFFQSIQLDWKSNWQQFRNTETAAVVKKKKKEIYIRWSSMLILFSEAFLFGFYITLSKPEEYW